MEPTGTPVATVATARRATFASLIAPLSLDDFLDRHWQRRHLVSRGEHRTDGGPIFGFADLDRYLALAAGDPEAHLSYGSAKLGGTNALVRDVALPDLYRNVARGGTVQLSAIERHWPAAADLADDIGRALDARVKVNVYLTPAGHQGAPIHGDLQDILVFQMEGSKDWYLYDETIFEPAETLGWIRHLGPPVGPLSEEAPVLERTTVHAGDLLYLPRGMVHRAVAAAGTPSVHLAICVTPRYWIDFIKTAIELVAAREPTLNRALDPRYARDPEVRAKAKAAFSELLALAAEGASFDHTVETLAHRVTTSGRLPADGHFTQILRLGDIGLETTLVRRAGLSCDVEIGDEIAIVRFAGGRIETTSALAPALTFVRDRERFRVDELPGLPPEAQRTLARRLVSAGFMRLDEAPTGDVRRLVP